MNRHQVHSLILFSAGAFFISNFILFINFICYQFTFSSKPLNSLFLLLFPLHLTVIPTHWIIALTTKHLLIFQRPSSGKSKQVVTLSCYLTAVAESLLHQQVQRKCFILLHMESCSDYGWFSFYRCHSHALNDDTGIASFIVPCLFHQQNNIAYRHMLRCEASFLSHLQWAYRKKQNPLIRFYLLSIVCSLVR